MKIPSFRSKSEALDWLSVNKDFVLMEKSNTLKHSDVLTYFGEEKDSSEDVVEKATITDINSIDKLSVKSVINSCGIIDSHMDCHMEGIWKKSLAENKVWYWLQEHRMIFENIIADSVKNDIKAFTEQIPYKQLGIKGNGSTECLVFSGNIDRRNEYMFKQYAKGYVLNHSVGMRYVKIFLCVNSEEKEWSEEKRNWDKYYDSVINKDVADSMGYFFAVTEAKFIEGSAVVIGSNQNTPTIEVEVSKDNEPTKVTQKEEPAEVTQKGESLSINSFNF